MLNREGGEASSSLAQSQHVHIDFATSMYVEPGRLQLRFLIKDLNPIWVE